MSKTAIDAPTRKTFLVDPHEAKIIGLDTKHKSRLEHRLWDERANRPVSQRFVDNIDAHGVIKIVLVEKDGKDILVVDGRQRMKACRLANEQRKKRGEEPRRVEVSLVLAREKDGKDVTSAMYSTNHFYERENPIDEARKIHDYLQLGHGKKETALVFNCSEKNIDLKLQLLQLDVDVQDALEAGKLTAASARPLASLSREEQKKALGKLLGPKTEAEPPDDADDPDAEPPKIRPISARETERAIGKTSARTRGPTKREIKQFLVAAAKGISKEVEVNDDFIRGARWASGDLPTDRIKGLTGFMTTASQKKAPPRPEKPATAPKKKAGGKKGSRKK